MHIYIHIDRYIYINTYIYTYMYIHICMCIYIYIYIRIDIDQPLSSCPCTDTKASDHESGFRAIGPSRPWNPTSSLFDVTWCHPVTTQSPQGLADPSGNLNRPYLRWCLAFRGLSTRCSTVQIVDLRWRPRSWAIGPSHFQAANVRVASSKIIVEHQEWAASKIHWFIIALPTEIAISYNSKSMYTYIYMCVCARVIHLNYKMRNMHTWHAYMYVHVCIVPIYIYICMYYIHISLSLQYIYQYISSLRKPHQPPRRSELKTSNPHTGLHLA